MPPRQFRCYKCDGFLGGLTGALVEWVLCKNCSPSPEGKESKQ